MTLQDYKNTDGYIKIPYGSVALNSDDVTITTDRNFDKTPLHFIKVNDKEFSGYTYLLDKVSGVLCSFNKENEITGYSVFRLNFKLNN